MEKLELLETWIKENIEFIEKEITSESYHEIEYRLMTHRKYAFETVLEYIEVLKK